MTSLSPRQQKVRDELLDPGGPRPTFPAQLHDDLRDQIRAAAADVGDRLATAGTQLYVNKYALDRVHVCERNQQAEAAAGFTGWTAARAQGVVAHQAVALGMFSSPPRPPLDLVDDVIAAYERDDNERSPGAWLRTAPAAERAELRAGASARVSMFDDCFPPLPAAWRPRVEALITAPIVRDVVVLAGKPDLVLGRADGTTARALVVDFKAGRPAAAHLDDARYYALLMTLRTGVPPYRSAAFYLDSGEWTAVDVDEDQLRTAARRVADAVVKLGELALGEREARAVPGPACAYCCVRESCDVAFGGAGASPADEFDALTPF